MVYVCITTAHSSVQVFSPVLQGLFMAMQTSSIVGNGHRQPIQALSDLVEVRCGPSGNVRPICRLLTHQVSCNIFFMYLVILGAFCTVFNICTVSSAITHVSLMRIGYNTIDEYMNAVCIMQTFAYVC